VGFEINSNIIRLAGNLVHCNKDGHDAIMAGKKVHLYVGFTKIDRQNPSAKECSIVFMKYMTDFGDSCSQYLSSLTKIDIEEDSKKFMKFDLSK